MYEPDQFGFDSDDYDMIPDWRKSREGVDLDDVSEWVDEVFDQLYLQGDWDKLAKALEELRSAMKMKDYHYSDGIDFVFQKIQ